MTLKQGEIIFRLTVLIAEFTLQSPILAATLERCPDVKLETDSQDRLDDGTVQLLLWVAGSDSDAFEPALEDDPSVRDYRCLATEGTRRFYRIRLSEEFTDRSVQTRWAELGGSRLSSVGTRGGWKNRVRFPDRAAFAEFYRTCREKGLDLTVDALYDRVGTDDGEARALALSEKQRQALSVAHERGYYEVPRSVSLDQLAADLDISDQALSERLRRGIDNMLDAADLSTTDN